MQDKPETVIEAGGNSRDYWKQFWRYRDVLFFLAWRDILVRYKQTIIGASWVLIRPLLTMVVFTLVFGKIARLPSDGIPYSLMVITGMLPWFLFSTGLSSISDSLVTNAALLSKVYFPRLLIPLSSALVAVVDFLVSLMLLVVMLLWFQHPMTWRVLAIPFVLLYALVVIVGLGLWAAAISVRYRDFRHLVPFFLQLWIYVSPIGYSSELIPERWRVIYALNPIVGIVEGFRWAVLGSAAELNTLAVVAAGLTSILLLLGGVRFFRQAETTFADVI